MKYTNTYDLMGAMVKLDPQASIASIDWEWGQGQNLSISTSAMPKDTEQAQSIKHAIWACLGDHFFSFCPPGTVDFKFGAFNVTDAELTADARWFIRHPSDMSEWDILGGQQDVWGADITIKGVPDFESIRAEINAAGAVQFDLEMNQTGWIKNELDLQILENEVEIEPDKLALIRCAASSV